MVSLLAILVLAATPENAAISKSPGKPLSQAAAATKQDELRTVSEINKNIRLAVRFDAGAKTSDAAQVDSILLMAGLHREIVAHPKFASSALLKKNRIKLWSRLTRHKKRLKRDLARQEKEKPSPAEPAAASLTSITKSSAAPRASQPSAATANTQQSAARGGGSIPDDGQGLIDLIERTIEPDFWDTNGGPGSIYYYRPLRVLVISATSEIHHRVGGNVKAIRKAGQ